MWVGLLNPLSLPGTSLGILALFQTFLFPVPLWNLNRGALALGFTLYFGRPWISISHTHTCIHTYPHHIHTPLTLGIWSSELAQQSVTLNTRPHSITIQAPRKPFSTPLASCPGKLHQTAWRWCAEHLQECQRQTSPQKTEGSEQKCLGKRKGKLINLSNPPSQLERSRCLYNELLFLSSAKHSFPCFSSCSSSWFWR